MLQTQANNNEEEFLTLYPPIEADDSGFLNVDEIHSIYYEESGNKNGVPVVYFHGGPGGGASAKSRQFFDPKHYRIIIFDQRGAGKSTPLGEIKNNTTKNLISDIEQLRNHLNIDKWHVFGGSWGSTLALCYAIEYRENILSLTLRGIFTMREKEHKWFTHGMKNIFPDAWYDFVEFLPKDERNDILNSYYKRLNSEDKNIYLPAAKAWSNYEGSCCKLIPFVQEKITDPKLLLELENQAYCIARIEAHYFVNEKFDPDDYILKSVDKFRYIPAVIVQGRYDVVCPIETAYELHRAWPEAEFKIIPNAGHSSSETGIMHELISATNKFRSIK